MEKSIKVAVWGFGRLGEFHCQKVEKSPLASLSFIVEPSHERALLAKKSFPQATVLSSDDALKLGSDFFSCFDAVVIASPTSTHRDLSLLMLKEGRHIFCEKPLCRSYEEAIYLEQQHALAEEQHQKKIIFQVGHIERFWPFWQESQLESFKDYLNPPFHLSFTRLAPYTARAKDVDVLLDLMIHDVDLMNLLVPDLQEEDPLEIITYEEKSCSEFIDVLYVDFLFSHKRKISFRAHRDYVKTVREVELINESGTLLFDTQLGKTFLSTAKEGKSENAVEVISYPKQDNLLAEHLEFYSAINERRDPQVSIGDAVAALKWIDYVKQNLHS